MSKYEHTFYYDDTLDLIRQIDDLMQKMSLDDKLEEYGTVRDRYPNLRPSAFCMRIKRFWRRGGRFPAQFGKKGKRLKKLSVTLPLHRVLTK